MPSSSPRVERCRPLLGTFVRVRVEGLERADADGAIDAAFAAIAGIERLMSFRGGDSDVVRLNHSAWRGPVPVDPRTHALLTQAVSFSNRSGGVFDLTIAPTLVARGLLPRPVDAPDPDAGADWRDLRLGADGTVRFARKLWIDLGGIAKGYAVDRAIDALAAFAPGQACVNAGGDLRVIGPCPERIALQPDLPSGDHGAFVELAGGSVASSCGRMARREDDKDRGMSHVDPRRSGPRCPWRFVSVVAPLCVTADALTKVVMAMGDDSNALLVEEGARAMIYEPVFGWREIRGNDAE